MDDGELLGVFEAEPVSDSVVPLVEEPFSLEVVSLEVVLGVAVCVELASGLDVADLTGDLPPHATRAVRANALMIESTVIREMSFMADPSVHKSCMVTPCVRYCLKIPKDK